MSDQSDRLICPYCRAQNMPSNQSCWQCGRAIFASADSPNTPSSEPAPSSEPGPGSTGGVQPPTIPPNQPRGDTQLMITLGFIFAGLSLIPVCCAWPFGIAAIILGIIATSRGDSRGVWVIVSGVMALIISFVLGQVLGQYLMRHLPQFQKGYGVPPSTPTPTR